MKEKPYKSYIDQALYLNSVKGIICNNSSNLDSLARIGYFNIINAYKSPFISNVTVDSTGKSKHIYSKGITIDHFLILKKFDDNIRHLLFRSLTEIEEEIKSVYGYVMARDNNDLTSWESFDFYDPSIKKKRVYSIVTSAKRNLSKSKNFYIDHYLEKYGDFPIWVVLKNLMLSDFLDIISISKVSSNESICLTYGILKNDGGKIKPDYNRLSSMLHIIREYRNICAHGERVFELTKPSSINSGYRISSGFNEFMPQPKRYLKSNTRQTLIDLIVVLKYFMDSNAYSTLLSEIIIQFNLLQSQLPLQSFDSIRAKTGIKNLNDLIFLSNNNPHNPDYSKLK